MCINLMAQIWGIEKGLTSTEKFVLLKLADSAPKGSTECFPSIKTIATQCSMSVSTVKRAVASLVGKKIVQCTQRHRDNGSCSSNFYVLNIGSKQDSTQVQNEPEPQAKMNPSPAQNEPGPPMQDEPSPLPKLNPHINHNFNRNNERESEREKNTHTQNKKSPFEFQFTKTQLEIAQRKKIDIDFEFRKFKDYWTAAELPKKFFGSRRFSAWLSNAKPEKPSGGNYHARRESPQEQFNSAIERLKDPEYAQQIREQIRQEYRR